MLGILSVVQLWQLEIAKKNMWDFENLNLPCALADLFQYIQHDSAAQARSFTNNLVSVSRPMITETHGRNCLTFIGAKILNELKLLELFKTPSKEKFVNGLCTEGRGQLPQMFSKPKIAWTFLSFVEDFHAVRIFHWGLWSDTKILAPKEPLKGPKIHPTKNKHVIKTSEVKFLPLPDNVLEFTLVSSAEHVLVFERLYFCKKFDSNTILGKMGHIV